MALGLVGAGAKGLASVINALIQLSQGFASQGPGATTNFTTEAFAANTGGIPLIAGHRYLVSARVDGTQNIAAGTAQIAIRTNGVTGPAIRANILNAALASGTPILSSGSAIYSPTSSGSESIFVTILTSAGVVTVGANAATVCVQDLGV